MVLRTFGIKIIITVVTSTNYEHCSSLDKVQVQNDFFFAGNVIVPIPDISLVTVQRKLSVPYT